MADRTAAGTMAADAGRSDLRQRIDDLRVRGAERFDPVGFRFIESLAQRAAGQRAGAARVLHQRLARALDDYSERFDRAEREAKDFMAHATARFPETSEALRRHCDTGDFARLRRVLTQAQAWQKGSPLAELTQAGHSATARQGTAVMARPAGELKALRLFRSTWSRLSVDHQLSRMLVHAPENAGPLNSHFLLLQSLAQLRGISAEYLEAFMSYADALLWLDGAGGARPPLPRPKRSNTRSKTPGQA